MPMNPADRLPVCRLLRLPLGLFGFPLRGRALRHLVDNGQQIGIAVRGLDCGLSNDGRQSVGGSTVQKQASPGFPIYAAVAGSGAQGFQHARKVFRCRIQFEAGVA